MAGIAAAVALARAGRKPTLVESRPYLGGRTRSFLHEASGDEIDNGQHLMMGCYRSTFELLQALGTRHLVEIEPALRVEFRDADGSRDLLIAHPSLPSPIDVFAGMMRLRRISLRERLSLARIGLSLRLRTPPATETVGDYLRRHGQSTRLQERLWNPITIATLNTPPEAASARLFVEVMRRAFLGRREDSHLAFATAGLSRLLAPAADYIESRGGSVMIGNPITAVERDEHGYRISLKDGEALTTSTVVSTLPPRALHPILRNKEMQAKLLPEPAGFTYAPIVSLYLWYDRDIPSLPMFSALIGTQVQWMFNRRKIDAAKGDRYPGLLSCTISAAFEEAPSNSDQVIAMADRELRGALPELRDAQLLDGIVVKEKHATFAATPAAELLRRTSATEFPGFYLAGDWTNTGLPATIEGAAQSGFAAASLVIG